MRWLIRNFDALVRRLQGVFEFSDDPEALLRLRLAHLAHPLVLRDSRFPAGAPMLEIHLWNERVPPIPPGGPDLAWAAQAGHRLRRSLQVAAAHVKTDPALRDLQVIGGTTVLADDPAAALLLRRLGFEIHPHPRPLGAFGEFWPTLYALGLMLAFNPHSVRGRKAASLHRRDLWMSMEAFLHRYGPRLASDDAPMARRG